MEELNGIIVVINLEVYVRGLVVILLCAFVAACGAKSTVYYDTKLAEYNVTELNKLDTENGILSLKTNGSYKEDDASLKIVFGMNNEIADFTRVGNIVNNFLTLGTYTGFSKNYRLTTNPENNNANIEFNAWNAGQKGITDGITSEIFVSTHSRTIEGLKNSDSLKEFTVIEDRDVTASYGTQQVSYKYLEATSVVNNQNVLIYEYRTAYNGSIVRIMCTFTNDMAKQSEAEPYIERFMKTASLKIMLDMDKIKLEEFNALKNQPERVYSEVTISAV